MEPSLTRGDCQAAAEQALAIDPNHQPTRAMLAETQLARQSDALQRR